MSVVSSRVSNVSSILKAPGVRSQLIRQSNRVYFKLPKNLKKIIYNFEAGNGKKDYEDLICILRDSNIKDTDLIEFLDELRPCVSLLGPLHKLLIEVLLQIKWTTRSPELASAYKVFLVDLICVQIYHAKFVIDSLIEQFKPDDNEAEWEAGMCKEEDVQRLNHVHDILSRTLKIVPMSSKLLLQSLRARFPYIIHGTHTHEIYVYALLQIIDYAPQLRSDILSLIVNRLIVLDVNIPRIEVDKGDEDLMDDTSECDGMLNNDDKTDDEEIEETSTVDPIAHKLDKCMELILKYMHCTCFTNGVLQIEPLKTLYFDILEIFETVILPTHASQYVQFILFYVCSFKTAVVEAFIDRLWLKLSDPSVASITRQSSAAYIASLLVTAKFVSPGLVRTMLSKMSKWIHNYIKVQERAHYVNDETKDHIIFHSICQALFFIISKRHKDYTNSKNYMLYLQELDLPKIISCKLNPLKACHPDVVNNFAEITRTYQLAYCYAIIENNARNQLPIFNNSHTMISRLDNFFPFSSYTLQYSKKRLIPLFNENSVSTELKRTSKHKEEVIEYMTE